MSSFDGLVLRNRLEGGFGGPMPDGMERFFAVIALSGLRSPSVLEALPALGMPITTLQSRFARAELPSPRVILTWCRLAYAAWLFEQQPGRSVADVALTLGFASSQSFNRHMRNTLGITPGAFRQQYPFHLVIDRFNALLSPHWATWRWFDPACDGSGRSTRVAA